MARTITEQRLFYWAELEEMAKFHAILDIIGPFYKGNFHHQQAEQTAQGIIILTTHTPAE